MATAKRAKIKRTNTTFTVEEQQEISRLMESKGTSRKMAIRKLRANQKAAARLREQAERNTPDFKSAAANDKPEATPVKAKGEPKPQTDAGKARFGRHPAIHPGRSPVQG
jgi:hypothetical protein